MMGDNASGTLISPTTTTRSDSSNPTSSTDCATLTLEPLNDTFLTKTILVAPERPIKIGRKVSPKSAPEPFNGIFDAKVLSRTHAEFLYENGAIFIRDLKSSNGTFVNGQRLSEEGVQSAPKQLAPNDILEFGIDIVDEDGKILYKKVAARVAIEYGGGNFVGTLVKNQVPSNGPAPQLSHLLNLVEEETRLSTEAADVLHKIRTSFDRMDPDKGDNVSERSVRTLSKPLLNESNLTARSHAASSATASRPPLSSQGSTLAEPSVTLDQFNGLQEKVASLTGQLAILSEQVTKEYARLDLETKSQYSAVQDVSRALQQVETTLQLSIDELGYRIRQLDTDISQKVQEQSNVAPTGDVEKRITDIRETHEKEMYQVTSKLRQMEERLEELKVNSEHAVEASTNAASRITSLSEKIGRQDKLQNTSATESEKVYKETVNALLKRIEAYEARLEACESLTAKSAPTSQAEPQAESSIPLSQPPSSSTNSFSWLSLLFLAGIVTTGGYAIGYYSLSRYGHLLVSVFNKSAVL